MFTAGAGVGVCVLARTSRGCSPGGAVPPGAGAGLARTGSAPVASALEAACHGELESGCGER